MSRRIAACCLSAILMAACFLLLRPHVSWSLQDREQLMAGPTLQHPAGTDPLGRDRLTRTAAACLLSLGLSAAAAVLTTAIAAIAGAWAGLLSDHARAIALLCCDVLLSLPLLFLLMLARSVLPLNLTPQSSATVTFLLFGLLSWPAGARLMAARAGEARQAPWLLQAQAAGVRPGRLLSRFFIPHMAPLLAGQFLTALPLFVIAEANMGLLGLGVSEPLPSWGGMLRELDNSAAIAASHWSFLPIAVLLVVVSLLQTLSTGEDQSRHRSEAQ